jgi:hypothetical protein
MGSSPDVSFTTTERDDTSHVHAGELIVERWSRMVTR